MKSLWLRLTGWKRVWVGTPLGWVTLSSVTLFGMLYLIAARGKLLDELWESFHAQF